MVIVHCFRHGRAQHQDGFCEIEDPELTAQGRTQVLNWRRPENCDAIYCSPHRRCLQTAEIVFPSTTIYVKERLRERTGCANAFKRSKLSSLKGASVNKFFDWGDMQEDDNEWGEQRETLETLRGRVINFCEEIERVCADNSWNSVVFVSHMIFLSILCCPEIGQTFLPGPDGYITINDLSSTLLTIRQRSYNISPCCEIPRSRLDLQGLNEGKLLFLSFHDRGTGFKGSQDMINFKLTVKSKDGNNRKSTQLLFRSEAIKKYAKMLQKMLSEPAYQDLRNYVWVPVPPSKAGPDADDRLDKVLDLAHLQQAKKLVIARESMGPSHHARSRPTVDELLGNYDWNPTEQCGGETNAFVLFDDVLTQGNHMIAMAKFLKNKFPDATIHVCVLALTF